MDRGHLCCPGERGKHIAGVRGGGRAGGEGGEVPVCVLGSVTAQWADGLGQLNSRLCHWLLWNLGVSLNFPAPQFPAL